MFVSQICSSFPCTIEEEEGPGPIQLHESLNEPEEGPLLESPSQSRELRDRANLQELHLLTNAYAGAGGAGLPNDTRLNRTRDAWTRTDWHRMYDPIRDLYYYHSTTRCETTWTLPPPSSPPPPPPMNSSTTAVAMDSVGNNGTGIDASIAALHSVNQLKRTTSKRKMNDTEVNQFPAKRAKKAKKAKKAKTSGFFCRVPTNGPNTTREFSVTPAEYPTNTDEDIDMKGPDTAIAMTISCCRKVRGRCLYTKTDLCNIGLAYDLDLTNMTREKQECELTCYYAAWHRREGTNYADSLCFQGESLKTDNPRRKIVCFHRLFVFTVSCIHSYKSPDLFPCFCWCVCFAEGNNDVKRPSKQPVKERKDNGQVWSPNSGARGGRGNFHNQKATGKNKDYMKTCSLKAELKKTPELREQSLFCVEVQSVDDRCKTFPRNGCRCCASINSKYSITAPNGTKGMGLPGSASRLKDHVKGARHIANLNKWKAHQLNVQGIKECVSHHKEAVHGDVMIFRQAFLEACAIDGVPLTTVCGPDSAVRDLLELNFGASLVGAEQMRNMHQEDALKKVVENARALVQNRYYSVICDGTDLNGNLESLLMRVVDDGVSSLLFVFFVLSLLFGIPLPC